MEFLLPHIEGRSTVTNLADTNVDDSTQDSELQFSEDLHFHLLPSFRIPEDLFKASAASFTPRRTNKSDNDNYLLKEMVDVMKATQDIRQKRSATDMDENDYFFLSMNSQRLWQSLRYRYTNEKRDMTKSGSEAPESSWMYYDKMLFYMLNSGPSVWNTTLNLLNSGALNEYTDQGSEDNDVELVQHRTETVQPDSRKQQGAPTGNDTSMNQNLMLTSTPTTSASRSKYCVMSLNLLVFLNIFMS
nr:unnamed protein product [Callosobruchus analis]